MNNDLDYINFCNFIYENFSSDKKVLDVGTKNSNLSFLLRNKGFEVTAMDLFDKEEIKNYKKNGIKCSNSYFNLKTSIDDIDLIVAYHACSACEFIIDKGIRSNKDFAVVLCELNKTLNNNMPKSRKSYINYLLNKNSNIKLEYLPVYFDDNSSWKEIIYYKKEK